MKKTDFQIFDFGDIRYTYTVYRGRYTVYVILHGRTYNAPSHGFRFPLCTRIRLLFPLVPVPNQITPQLTVTFVFLLLATLLYY